MTERAPQLTELALVSRHFARSVGSESEVVAWLLPTHLTSEPQGLICVWGSIAPCLIRLW